MRCLNNLLEKRELTMDFLKEIEKYLPFEQKKEVNVGKIIFKTAAITTAILAFVPTVFKINKGKGFDAYGLLSHVKYEKKTNEEGNAQHEVSVTLVDLERYGIKELNVSEEAENDEEVALEVEAIEAVEEDENCSCVEK